MGRNRDKLAMVADEVKVSTFVRRRSSATLASHRRSSAPPLQRSLLYAMIVAQHSSHVACQIHSRREEMYFYTSSLLDGKLYCLFALSLGEHFCDAQLQLVMQKWNCLCCWTQS
jgi:hypothetical protein